MKLLAGFIAILLTTTASAQPAFSEFFVEFCQSYDVPLCTPVVNPVDTDGDGVDDAVDQCPNTYGLDGFGCPVIIVPGVFPTNGLTKHAVNESGVFTYPVNDTVTLNGDQTYIVRFNTGATLPTSSSTISNFTKGGGNQFGFSYTKFYWQFYFRAGYSSPYIIATSSDTPKRPKANTEYLLVFVSSGGSHTFTAHNIDSASAVLASSGQDFSGLNMSGFSLNPEGPTVSIDWLAHWSRALTISEINDILADEGGGPVVVPANPDLPVGILRDPISDNEIIAAINRYAPAQHSTEARFKKIGGSDIDVLTGANEFPYCSSIKCFASNVAFTDWTGGTWNWRDWEFTNPAGGGHYDYGGNEVYLSELKLDENDRIAVKWSRPIAPSALEFGDCGAPLSGPVASHHGAAVEWVEAEGEYWHQTNGGFPSTPPCGGISNSAGRGGWTHKNDAWTKVSSTQMQYARSCYHRNRNKIYAYQWNNGAAVYEIDPAAGYTYTQIGSGYMPSVVKGWGSSMDQARDICYYYNNQVGIRGVHFDPVSGSISAAFSSIEATIEVSSLSVEHSTGNLVIANGGREVLHVDVDTGLMADISGTAGESMPAVTKDAENLYGKFDMIEKIPCVGIGLSDARQGVYLMTLPSSVCDRVI